MIAWIEANIVFAWLLWALFVAIAAAWLDKRSKKRRRGLDISEVERKWRERR